MLLFRCLESFPEQLIRLLGYKGYALDIMKPVGQGIMTRKTARNVTWAGRGSLNTYISGLESKSCFFISCVTWGK